MCNVKYNYYKVRKREKKGIQVFEIRGLEKKKIKEIYFLKIVK